MTSMTHEEAEIILEGFAAGALDGLDLRCLIEDYDGWVRESFSYYAGEVRKLRGQPQVGFRIKLIAELTNEARSVIAVETSIPVGTEGTITRVAPSVGQIGVAWDNGSTLMLLFGHDDGKWELL